MSFTKLRLQPFGISLDAHKTYWVAQFMLANGRGGSVSFGAEPCPPDVMKGACVLIRHNTCWDVLRILEAAPSIQPWDVTERKPLDSIVSAVMDAFGQRAGVGRAKYGTDLDRKDLSLVQWIQHTQEELMDATLYLQKLKVESEARGLR